MAIVNEIITHEDRSPAPSDLELLRRFVNLHQHATGNPRSLPPSLEVLRDFLVRRGLLDAKERFTPADREKVLALAEALRARVAANQGEQVLAGTVTPIERAAFDAGLRLRFFAEGPPKLEPTAQGLDAALGRLAAIAFLAQLDGTWDHLKRCADEDCRAVFNDRSKNHSGKWCSMQSCGNRNKVRAWRARQAAE
jgi:predicted RNA-binding Zn ribbon-like protein